MQNRSGAFVEALLDKLAEAESFVGSPVTTMFMDNLGRESFRWKWLKEVRVLLREGERTPENLQGPWHTPSLPSRPRPQRRDLAR